MHGLLFQLPWGRFRVWLSIRPWSIPWANIRLSGHGPMSGRSPNRASPPGAPVRAIHPPHCPATRPILRHRPWSSARSSQGLHQGCRFWHRHSRYAGENRCYRGCIQPPNNRPRPSRPQAAARRPCRQGPRLKPICLSNRHCNAGVRPRQRFHRCPAQCPGCQCKSMIRRSFAHTSSNPFYRVR